MSYLEKKERLIVGGHLGWAASEDDLLAHYLRNINESGEHDSMVPPECDALLVEEGHWQEFRRHPQRLAQVRADEISYSWDRLIESFAGHILANTQHYTTHHNIRDGEKILRFMAHATPDARAKAA